MRGPAFITGADPRYYEVLGVASNAGQAQIAAAYRALMRRHHPDAAGDRSAGDDMAKRITEAFSVLGHLELRRQYDAVHGYPRPAAPTQARPLAKRKPPPRSAHGPSGPRPVEPGVSTMMAFALFIAVAAIVLVVILFALSLEQRAVIRGPLAAPADGPRMWDRRDGSG